MSNGNGALTANDVRELLDYTPETGVFVWRARTIRERYKRTDAGWNTRRAGTIAGYVSDSEDGQRLMIRLNKRLYLAHRLAWLHVHGEWPEYEIDHRNRNPMDNRLVNLRVATGVQNHANTGVRKDSKSGVKGVSQAPNGNWVARIRTGGRNPSLGTFPTIELASAAYTAAAIRLHGEFAYTGEINE